MHPAACQRCWYRSASQRGKCRGIDLERPSTQKPANPRQDAAVAVAAAINVMEPGSTGIGGDMFCLFYDAKTKKVHAMNGSGRSGQNVTLDKIRSALNIKDGENGQIPMTSVHAVTVPGAAAGWVDTVERFGSGKVSLEDVLAPAIDLAENGYPISELSATFVSFMGVQTPTLR